LSVVVVGVGGGDVGGAVGGPEVREVPGADGEDAVHEEGVGHGDGGDGGLPEVEVRDCEAG